MRQCVGNMCEQDLVFLKDDLIFNTESRTLSVKQRAVETELVRFVLSILEKISKARSGVNG